MSVDSRVPPAPPATPATSAPIATFAAIRATVVEPVETSTADPGTTGQVQRSGRGISTGSITGITITGGALSR